MSDQNRAEEPLEEQILLLKNALIRERNAKRKLEEKLEEKVHSNFEDNRAFFQAYENANSRQIQLQFLSSLTSDIFTMNSMEKMTARFLANISAFLDPCNAFILSKVPKRITLTQLERSNESFKEISNPGNLASLFNSLNRFSEHSVWQRISDENVRELPELQAHIKHDTVLIYPLALSKLKQQYILLDINHYCYSHDFKQTLSTATQQFSMAVQRLIAEVDLSHNYKKLKSTLKELKSTQHQLVHSKKMASLGQLSAGIAHEINNPLGYITSNFEVLKDYCELFEQAFESVSDSKFINESTQLQFAREDVPELIVSCIKGVSRISDIVSSLKTFSKKSDDKFEQINLNEVIDHSLKIVWNQLKYDHQVDKNLSTSLPTIYANEGQLQQVFVNLFINASQAMKAKGTLSITTKAVDKYIEVSIIDTGYGMSQSTIEQLFEPFYTTKQDQGGTGLGLSVSYAIIEKHQALISVNSELGVGSEFTIRFPQQ